MTTYDSTTGDASNVWITWNNSSTTTTSVDALSTTWEVWAAVYSPPPAPERQRSTERAQAVAKGLLLDCLDKEQAEEFQRRTYFHVMGSKGTRFQVRRGRTGNVGCYKNGRLEPLKFCAHPTDHVPDYDTMLAQKLMIETDEDAFRALANRW